MKIFLEKSKLPTLTQEKIRNVKKVISLDNLNW